MQSRKEVTVSLFRTRSLTRSPTSLQHSTSPRHVLCELFNKLKLSVRFIEWIVGGEKTSLGGELAGGEVASWWRVALVARFPGGRQRNVPKFKMHVQLFLFKCCCCRCSCLRGFPNIFGARIKMSEKSQVSQYCSYF